MFAPFASGKQSFSGTNRFSISKVFGNRLIGIQPQTRLSGSLKMWEEIFGRQECISWQE
jgi:hypothetical protein